MGCSEQQLKAIEATLSGASGIDAGATAQALCDIFSTSNTVDDLQANVEEAVQGLNTFFLIYGGALVFIMHGGFAMLEAGAIRSKNAMNILLCTILDAAVAAIMWYTLGFGFAFGASASPNKFIGSALFGLSEYKTSFTGSGTGNWVDWFFQWAFCATAATIPAGAVAERFNFNAYMGYSAFISGFLYPVVVHWVWCVDGWLGYGTLEPVLRTGMIDFAGSAVVHMVGGLTGLVGAAMVGPRLGRFDAEGRPVDMPGHSAILVVLGTMLLWFGWYGFNPASVLLISTKALSTIAGRAAVTTTLAGASGGLMCLLNAFRRQQGWNLVATCNGILCGFVAITASCHVVEPWAAILCGGIGGLWFDFLAWVLLKLRIDDPLGAAPMHGGAGMWGVFFTGLLAKEEYVREYYLHAYDEYPYGAFYPGGGGKLLGSQIIGILVIAAWVVCLMVPFFAIFKFFNILRVPPEVEEMGLDKSKHGGSAYHMRLNRNSADGGVNQYGNQVMRNNYTEAKRVDSHSTKGATVVQVMPHPRTPSAVPPADNGEKPL